MPTFRGYLISPLGVVNQARQAGLQCQALSLSNEWSTLFYILDIRHILDITPLDQLASGHEDRRWPSGGGEISWRGSWKIEERSNLIQTKCMYNMELYVPLFRIDCKISPRSSSFSPRNPFNPSHVFEIVFLFYAFSALLISLHFIVYLVFQHSFGGFSFFLRFTYF